MGCAQSKIEPEPRELKVPVMPSRPKTPSEETINYPDAEDEPRGVRFTQEREVEPDEDDIAESEFPDFGDGQSTYGDRLMSANVRSSRPSSTLFSPSLMMTETVADTTSFHSDTSVDYRAPSLSLWYDDNVKGDILIQDVYVPSNGLTKQTYYCCLQWNSGINGGGYCGIQDHGKGRNYIFSIWDPIGTTEKIRPIYVGPGTICEPFGGEGTGLKSWNFELGWDPDRWYTFVCRRWDEGDHTYYGLWVNHHIEGQWSHLVTVDFPVANTYFETWTCSFLEDWEGTGQNERRVHFKNGYKRQIPTDDDWMPTWLPFNKAVFGIVKEFSSSQHAENYDSGSFEETFYLQSGGKTRPLQDFTSETVLQKAMPPEPDTMPVSCYLISVTAREIVWEIPSGSVPQFQYIVKIDGELYKQGINSEMRMCRIDIGMDESIELIIEDLYGKMSRIKYLVREGRELELRSTKSAKLLLNQKTLLEEEEDFLDDIPDDGATDAETLITGLTTPFRGQSAGATTLFTDYEPSESELPMHDDDYTGAGDHTDRSSLRDGAITNATMETSMYPPSPDRRSEYPQSGKPGSKSRVTLETPMYPHSGQAKHRRWGAKSYATSETGMYPGSPGGPSTYAATSAKSKARTYFTADTDYQTTSGGESPYPLSEGGRPRTYATSATAKYPSSNGSQSPYQTNDKTRVKTPSSNGSQTSHQVSERGRPTKYKTTNAGKYPSSDASKSSYQTSVQPSLRGRTKAYQRPKPGRYSSSEGILSPYPASERGRAKTYQTTDTAMYPSSAGGTLYPSSEVGATTMYATSVGGYETDGETLHGYATSDVETSKYYTEEGETEMYSGTDSDEEYVY